MWQNVNIVAQDKTCAYRSEHCVGVWVGILYVQGIWYFDNFVNLQSVSEVVGLDIWL